jgi:ParB family transcriptional regulator, chromosome partitioning protein
MTYREIVLKKIDWDDETFRISEELDSIMVLNSLKEIGLLNPIVVLQKESHTIIVCGFRRSWALKRLGYARIPARVLSEETHTKTQLFEMALWDNLSHRQLNPLEKSRILFKFRNICGISSEVLTKVYLPLLGLTPHESLLQAHLALHDIRPGLRLCLADGRLTLSSIEMLSKTPDAVQDAFASLMARIRLSASSQRKFLGLLEDLAAMTETQLYAPLDNPEASGILDDARLSPFQKGDRLYEILYRRINPRLSRAWERFDVKKKRLCLPGSVRLTPHPFFETSDLHVEFDASTSKRFRELADALQKASQSPELDELFQIE